MAKFLPMNEVLHLCTVLRSLEIDRGGWVDLKRRTKRPEFSSSVLRVVTVGWNNKRILVKVRESLW